MKKMINNIASVLEGVTTAAIAGHVRPDGDCVGSCMGMYLYLKENYPQIQADVYLEEVPEVFHFIQDIDKAKQEWEDKAYDLFLSFDVSSIDRIGVAGRALETAKMTACIDHHITNKGLAQKNQIVPDASSTCEVLYELLEPEKINKACAEALYTGIVHDTGVFQYSCTSEKTMEAAGVLMGMGIDFPKIVDQTFFTKTYEQNRIMGLALVKSKLHLDGKCISSIITAEEMREYNVLPKHLDGIVSQLRVTKDVEAAVFLYQTDEENYKVSTRSASYVDVAKIAAKYGGGGHVRAAGFSVAGDPEKRLNEIIEDIREQITD